MPFPDNDSLIRALTGDNPLTPPNVGVGRFTKFLNNQNLAQYANPGSTDAYASRPGWAPNYQGFSNVTPNPSTPGQSWGGSQNWGGFNLDSFGNSSSNPFLGGRKNQSSGVGSNPGRDQDPSLGNG